MGALIIFQSGILLLLLLLSRIQFSNGFSDKPDPAELRPINPNVEVGDTLVLNCTLTPLYTGSYNASDLYFRLFNTQNYTNPDVVRTLSNLTAQLRLPNMTFDMKGRYRCCLPRTSLGLSAVQDVNVNRRPLRPVLDGCIISNWEQMECSWSPSREEQDIHTHASSSFVQTLFYLSSSDDDNWRTCPLNGSNNCTWPSSQFKMNETYRIQINATNILKHTVASSVTWVLARDGIVKPNPPNNIESSFASEYDGQVTLTWNPPTSAYNYETPLLYQLNIQNHWHDQVEINTSATSMKLSIVPSTSYIIQISVRPSRIGFASENATKEFVTPATVPCKNPHTRMNAFHLVRETGKFILYWQPISERDFCGSNLSYEVRASQQSDGATESAKVWRDVSSVTSHDNCTEVTLRREEDEVTILSKNSVGIANQLPHVVIRIPSSHSTGNSSLNYRLVVEGNNNNVLVRWFATVPVENVMSHTLFWCQRLSFTRNCNTPIQWKNLNGSDSDLTLSENYLYFQVGLAVNFRSGFTTGIMWADRLYSQTEKIEAPRIVKVVTPYLGSHGEIDISWTPAPCNKAECAYVDTFVIYYCLADHQNMCHGENESVSIASWKSCTYSLVNLEHGSNYGIWMTSVGRTGSSNPSEPKFITTTKSRFTAEVIVGIVFAGVFLGIVVIGGLYACLQSVNKCRKRFVNGLNVPIATPPTHRVQLQSTSSEAPMLDTKFDFSHQVSISSGDSGHCSLSPASQATSPLLSESINASEYLDSFIPANFCRSEEVGDKCDGDDESTHGCVLSYTIVSNGAPKGKPKLPNSCYFLTNYNAPEETKDEDDDEEEVSTHGCVLSYTIVSNDAPKGDPTVPNGPETMGDHPAMPIVVSSGEVTRQSQYILPQQMELLGMSPRNPTCTRSEVNYCPEFNLNHPPPGNLTLRNYVADFAYTRVEAFRQPLNNWFPTANVSNERSQDSDVLQFDTDKATSRTDLPLVSDLQIDDPTTSSEHRTPELLTTSPRPGDSDTPLRDYLKTENTDFPSLACDDVEWAAGTSDFPQQLPSSNWGYVDHAMFGVDSVA